MNILDSIIYRFRMCKFIYSLNEPPKLILVALLPSFTDIRRQKILICLTRVFLADGPQKTFLILVSALTLYRGIFFLVYSVPLSCICVLFVGTFELNMVPKYTAQVLSSVPQWKKAVIYLTEKIRVLDTLHSGKNDSAVDKSTIYIKEVVFEQKHTCNVFSSWQECLTRCSEEPKPIISLGAKLQYSLYWYSQQLHGI